MKTKYLLNIVPLLPILLGCQTEAPQDISHTTTNLIVKASFPGNDNTRTQITYGNPDKAQEIFSWTEEDEIFLYNMTQFNAYPDEACFEIQPIFGKSAEFKFASGSGGHAKEFKVNSGDVVLAVYGETGRYRYRDTNDIVVIDERNIVRIGAGTEANSPQIVVKDPNDDSMSYMQGNLKMYDIVTVTDDDIIPDLHFKHLSAIIRVTLRNETCKEFYPTKIEVKYPETESFFNTNIYCSVDKTLSNESGLQVYAGDDIFKSSDPYTDHIGTTINCKNETEDVGEVIAPGQTYNLYLSTVPRIGNEQKGDKLIIDLIKSHDTDHPYRITLEGFDVSIEAGKRYWFNLTAVEEDGENKLMLTSEWLEKQKNQNATKGE